MSADTVQTLKIKAGDLACPICCERFDLKDRLPMSLLCGHTFCSYCLQRITICSTCRSNIDRTPSRNIIICSMIEAHPSNSCKETCSLHLQPRDVLCPETKEFICAHCFFENQRGISTLKSINTKAEKLKENRDEVNRKRQSAVNDLEELLADACDEKLARVLSIQKKQRRDIDAFYYSERQRLQHEILAADLVKSLQNHEKILEKWQECQDPNIAAEIIEADFVTGQQMEDFDQKVTELKSTIQANAKNIRESQIYNGSSQHQLSYLCQTFEEYGFKASTEGEISPKIHLRTSRMRPILKRFYPKYFDCTVSSPRMKCFNDRNFNFEVLCDIVGNINMASLNLWFHKPLMSEFELLLKLIFQSKNKWRYFSLEFPVAEKSRSWFIKFIKNIKESNRVKEISLNCDRNRFLFSMYLELLECPLKNCIVKFIGGIRFKTMRESLEAFSKLMKSAPLETLTFEFHFSSTHLNSLKCLWRFLQDIQSLKNLKLDIKHPEWLISPLLTPLILETIVKHTQLKTLELILPEHSNEAHLRIDDLCGQFGDIQYSNNNLQELNLILCNFGDINLQNMLIFICCFSQLKTLKLVFYKVKEDLAAISEFFKRIHKLTSLEKLVFEFYTPKKVTPDELQHLRCQLPSSLNSEIVFQEFSREVGKKYFNGLLP